MNHTKHIKSRSILLSIITLICLLAGRGYAYAQTALSSTVTDDSLDFAPPMKFDFGAPNPNADISRIEQPVDFLRTASTADIEKSRMDAKAGRGIRKSVPLSGDDTEYAVGQIPCQESVSPFGGRIYTVPIMVSPLSKFRPQVSLQYNSQAGNGLAGYGWNIAGLSSITLANKSIYYNGEAAHVNIDDADAVYTLDGVPLVQSQSPLKSEYPLETAKGHILVKAHKTGNVINYFTVLYPDGSKATFGMESNSESRIVYPLTLQEDRLGNRIEYDYSASDPDYRISTIKFKHKQNSTYAGQLSFNYLYRTDCVSRHRVGKVSNQSYILKNVTSISNNVNICTYNLTHELRDNVNLLTSIDCTNAQGEKLRPLTFEYGSSDDAVTTKDFTRSDNLFLSTYFSTSSDVEFIYNRGKYLSGSYNDGLMILPRFSNYAEIGTQGILKRKLFGSTYAADQEVLLAPRLSWSGEVDNSIIVGSGFQCINAVDIDGDGVDEIVKVNFNGTSESASTTTLKITVYCCDISTGRPVQTKSFNVTVNGIVKHGKAISPMCRNYYFGDFNGDGRVQLLTISYNKDLLGNSRTSYASLIDLYSGNEISETNLLSLGIDDELFCIDLEGDGKTDVCHVTTAGTKVYNLYGTTFSLTKSLSVPFISPNSSDKSTRKYHFLDINGDGYVDIAREPYGSMSNWGMYYYYGDKFYTQGEHIDDNIGNASYMFFDVNKDGLPDLVKRHGTSVDIFLNKNGHISIERITSNLSFNEKAEFVPGNMMGYDAMSDFITVEGAYVNLYEFTQDLSSSRMLTRFTNSLGATTVNEYADMARSNYVYLVDASRTYNNVNGYAKYRFPLQLLYNSQSYLTPDLSESEKVSNLWYTYFDACVNSWGLGFCGFGKVRTTDFLSGTTNKEPVTIETKNPEMMGVTTRLVQGHRMTQDNPYDITDYTYDGHTTLFGKANPRLEKVVHEDKLTTRKEVTTYIYDSYDYPKSVKVDRTLGVRGLLKESQAVSYVHKTSSDNYLLGSVASSEKTKTIPERTSVPINKVISMPDDGADVANGGGPVVPVDPFEPIDTTVVIHPIDPPIPASYWVEKQVFTYNDAMLPLSKIEYVGPKSSELKKAAETRWTYDAFGNVLSEMSAPFNVTTFIGKSYTYSTDGRTLQSMTNELGQTTTYSDYDSFGNPLKLTDHRGRVTSYEANAWGEIISNTAPDGTVSSTTREWGGKGCYTTKLSTTGKPDKIVHYDALEREVRTGNQRFDGQWQYVDKVYGKNGQIQKVSLPFRGSGEPVFWNTYAYDEYLRPVSCTQASGKITTWTYDKENITETKNGIWSTKTIDSNGQVVKIQDAGGSITYTLLAGGQPSEVSVTGGLSTTFEYDGYGRRTKIVDPSAGTQTDAVVHNADGSSVSTHTNPNGSVITYADRYGRTTRVERPGEYNTDYVYDANGLLTSEVSSNGTSKVYTYDALDRVLTLKETVPDGKWLKKTFTYGTGSNVSSIAYESQSGAITTEDFSYSNGTNVCIGVQGTPVRQLNSENDFGQPTSVTTGGIGRSYSFSVYGLPTRRTLGTVMDCSYAFDPLTGNLLSRTDNLRSRTEEFGYDELNRLTAIDDRVITYSDNGNITRIDDVGRMSYSSSKPYQLTSLVKDNEDVVPSRLQKVGYTCYSRPSIMTEGGRSAAFTYNGDGDRVKMNVAEGASSVLVRYYIGKQYEMDVKPSGTTERFYLGGDAYSAPMVYIREGSGSWTLYNIGRDYLGNITHIATSNGTLVEENSYDPWGRLRNPSTQEIYATGCEPELMLGRGYTGHEHLTWFGLINMNARLYDPVVGRFLSPDPYVQMPDFTQNFNRYSYCLNNPLVYVDENGEFCVTTMLIVGAVCAAVFAAGNLAAHAIRGDDLGHGNWAKYFFSGAIAGFVVGTVGYAACAGFTAMATSNIGFVRAFGKTAAFVMKWGPVIATGVNFLGSAVNGIANKNGQWFNNFGKTLLGNFYLDENRSFFGQVWDGISRFTWEYPQQMVGYTFSAIRNFWSERVDYLGGATFVTNFNDEPYGVTMGSFINIQSGDSNSTIEDAGGFDYYMMNDTNFMVTAYYAHEYGHILQSKKWGLLYLGIPGLCSLVNCRKNARIDHDDYWTETYANAYSRDYYQKYHPSFEWDYKHCKTAY